MNKKQMIAVIVAVLLFVGAGLIGFGTNIISSLLFSSKSNDEETEFFPTKDFVGVVDIVGTIQDLGEENVFSTTGEYNHTTAVKYIEELTEAENNVGILLYIDSPGGYANIGDDLYLELLEYKEETGRPIYAYFDSLACSAAYYAAMAADEIYANRMTTTGSIGVYTSYYDMSELFEKVGIKEVIIKSGNNKAMGSSGTPLTDEQYQLLQNDIDYVYEIFVDVVVAGRDLDRQTVYKIADGRSYNAEQALELDLIDGIMRYEEYKERVKENLGGNVEFYYKDSMLSPFAGLLGELKDMTPKSDYQAITEMIEKNENGGYKYESICR